MKTPLTEANTLPSPSVGSGALLGVARPHTDRPAAYREWLDSLCAENDCYRPTKGEEAVAFTAFIAGWYLRTGENPDSFSAPNASGQTRPAEPL